MAGYRRRTEIMSLTNMCMVEDADGRVCVLDKIKGGYTGLTFPGGHVEEGESLHDAAVREVREETGLEISNPVFCGIYHWENEGIHHMIFLYRANEFTGKLRGSDEGDVCFVPLEEFKKMELAQGMHEVIEICSGNGMGECHMVREEEGGEYTGRMY